MPWWLKPLGLALLMVVVAYVVGSVVIGIGGEIIGLPRTAKALLIFAVMAWYGVQTWRKQAAKARPPDTRTYRRLYEK